MAIQSKYCGITGPELRAERKAAGLSQATLAERAAIGRHAVIYWEKKPERFWRGWAIGRMFKVLGLTVLSDYWTNTRAYARARGWGLSPRLGTRPLGQAVRDASCPREGQSGALSPNLRGQDSKGPTLPLAVRTRQAALQVPRRQKHRTEDDRGQGTDCQRSEKAVSGVSSGSRRDVENAIGVSALGALDFFVEIEWAGRG